MNLLCNFHQPISMTHHGPEEGAGRAPESTRGRSYSNLKGVTLRIEWQELIEVAILSSGRG